MTEFTNPVPENRTIVPGVWSDLLDKWLDSAVNDGDATATQVALLTLISRDLSRQTELMQSTLIELRIANKFNELGHDEIIDEDSIHEDRRR